MSAWQTWHTPQQLEHANAYYVRLYGGTSPAARKVRLREERERWEGSNTGIIARKMV